MRKTPLALTALVVTGVLLAGCSGPSTGEGSEDPAADRRVVAGMTVIPDTLDPVMADLVQTDTPASAVYNKLVDYDGDGSLTPQLATSWEYNDDATAVTLTLRDDVTFHSGNAFTAADVVYTLDRTKRLGVGVASFIGSYDVSTAVDETTVEIMLTGTNTTFVGALSKLYILDSALVQENEGSDDGQTWLATHEAGSGPYVIEDYAPNQYVEYARADDAWEFDETRPGTLILQFIADNATLRDEFIAGDIDVVPSLTGEDLERAGEVEGAEIVTMTSTTQLYVMMNTQKGITADPRVREAIQLAYDYAGHIVSAMNGEGKLATGIVGPGLANRVDVGEPVQDVVKAKQLVAEAGVEGASLTMVYQPVIPEHNAAATLLQSNLADIGIDLQLKTITYPEYSAMLQTPDELPELALIWDFPAFPETGPTIYRVYHSKFIGLSNYTLYSNPEVDALLDEATTTTDAAAAGQLLEQAQEIIIADRLSVNISNPIGSVIMKAPVTGISSQPTFRVMNLAQIRIAP